MLRRRSSEAEEGNEEDTPKRNDDVRISAFGVTALVPSKLLTSTLLALAGFIAIGYMIRDHDIRAIQSFSEARTEFAGQVVEIKKQQKDLQESIDMMIYIISLPQDKRDKLQLQMPEALRSRLLDEERAREHNAR